MLQLKSRFLSIVFNHRDQNIMYMIEIIKRKYENLVKVLLFSTGPVPTGNGLLLKDRKV
jgi:hypothetical protein